MLQETMKDRKNDGTMRKNEATLQCYKYEEELEERNMRNREKQIQPEKARAV